MVAGVSAPYGGVLARRRSLTTLLQVGVAAMVLGCLCLLIALLERVGEREP